MLSRIQKAAVVSLDDETFSLPTVELADLAQSTDDGAAMMDENQLQLQLQADLRDVEQRCQEQLQQAEMAAQEILAAAQADALRLREEAVQQGHQDGYTLGYQEGMEACKSTCDQLLNQAQGIVQGAKDHRIDLLRAMAEPVTKLVGEAVTVLLQRELELAPANIEQMVGELLQHVMESSSAEIRVHPDDFVTAMAAHPKWMAAKFGDWEVAIVPDPGVPRGGCEIRSEYGRIDAQVGTRMELLQVELRRIVSEEVNRRVG